MFNAPAAVAFETTEKKFIARVTHKNGKVWVGRADVLADAVNAATVANWEADHVVIWKRSNDTTVIEGLTLQVYDLLQG